MKANAFAMARAFRVDHPATKIRQVFLGHPLRNSGHHHERLGFWLGLPILAVDALSSVAYATEEILLALSVYSAALLSMSVPIAISIVFLMAVLVASYRQTVDVYPNGGGAYTVSKEHLGTSLGLVAASSLLLDYILTVAVSVTAGVRAICSAYPDLLVAQTRLCVFGICMLCWLNLRGIRESASVVAVPIYAFILSMVCLSGWSLWTGLQGGAAIPAAAASLSSGGADGLLSVGAFAIVLRAFAGGCTAMTGIEAIANAGNILERPTSVVAKRILLALGVLLGFMFLSVTISVALFDLKPVPSESLLSLLLKRVWGDGIIHQGMQILTATILFLAANTAFAGAPRLTAILARDGWLPKQLYALGDRLVFNQGIVWLALVACMLVVLFDGDVHSLIPLYAIGVFTAFTLSQAGMVRYWLFESRRFVPYRSTHPLLRRFCPAPVQRFLSSPKMKASVNFLGAILTGLALCITFEAKFFEGSFVILFFVPASLYCFYKIQHHYAWFKRSVAIDGMGKKKQTFRPKRKSGTPIVVPVSTLHRGTYEALAFARSIGSDVRAIIVDIDHPSVLETKQQIDDLGWGIDVHIVPSPYRSIVGPVIQFLHQIDDERQKKAILVLPELVPPKWWQGFLHNKTAQSIVDALSWRETLCNQVRIIINVPYYLQKDGA